MSIFRRTTQVIIYTVTILLLTACFNNKKAALAPSIIPVPSEQVINKGVFLLNNDTKLIYDEELKEVANFTKLYLENSQKIKLNSGSKNSINFKIDTSISNDEGYQLKITPQEILIAAKNSKGAFYAFQSLRQLLPTDFEKSNEWLPEKYKNGKVMFKPLNPKRLNVLRFGSATCVESQIQFEPELRYGICPLNSYHTL